MVAATPDSISSDLSVALPSPPVDASIASGSALRCECPQYCDLMQEALAVQAGIGFGDVEHLDAFRLTGPDNEGRPVFMFIPGNIPKADNALIAKLTLYVLSIVHDVVIRQQKRFTVVWLCNNQSDSKLSLSWFRRTYYAIPFVFHERLANLCLVHPSLKVRLAMFLLSYLPKVSFWEKLNFCDRLEFLDSEIPVKLIKTVPKSYKDYDKELDMAMYHGSDATDDRLGVGSIGSMANNADSGFDGGGSSRVHASLHPRRLNQPGDDQHRKPSEMPALPKRNWELD